MQTNDAQSTGEKTTTVKIDTAFKTMDEFMATREAEGMNGPISPNMQLVLDITDKLRDFSLDLPEAEKDSFIWIGNLKGGTNDKGNTGMMTLLAIGGAPHDLLGAIVNVLDERPELIGIFEAGARVARDRHLGDMFSHVADFFKNGR